MPKNISRSVIHACQKFYNFTRLRILDACAITIVIAVVLSGLLLHKIVMAEVAILSHSTEVNNTYSAAVPQSKCTGKKILLIGATPIPLPDAQIVAYLTIRGFEVETTGLANIDPDKLALFDLIMVSRSVTSNGAGDTLTSIDVPLLTWEAFLYDDLLMSGSIQDVDFGQALNSTSINIVEEGHRIAAGLTGSVSTHSSPNVFHWGKPSASATVIASIDNAPSQAAIFVYEKGDEMVGTEAPERRVALHDVAIDLHTKQGNQIFDAAISWAINCKLKGVDNDEYLLTVEVEGQGTVRFEPQADSYQPGDLVILEAFPARDWKFAGWEGNVVTALNPTFLVFEDTDELVKATFIVSPTATITPTVTSPPTVVNTPVVTPTSTPPLTPTITTTTPIATPTVAETPTPLFTSTPFITSTPMPTMTPIVETPIITPTLTSTPAGEPPVGSGSGSITRDWWFGLEDALSVDSLIELPSYPSEPTGSDEQSAFRIPTGWGALYGTRIHGYLHPPVTGIYTFYIAGDDRGLLFLSTDEDPKNERQIAEAPDWTFQEEWNKYPEQQSLIVQLEAGRRYYIKALHVQGAAGDHLQVGWEGPGFTAQVIDGQYLSPFIGVVPTATFVPPTGTSTATPDLGPGTTPEPPATPMPTNSPTAMVPKPNLSLEMRDSLLVDNDDDGRADFGDTILYEVQLTNSGDATAKALIFQHVPEGIVTLGIGTVETSRGQVEKGNQVDDGQVLVNIGDVPAQGVAQITFEVKIAGDVIGQPVEISAQGIVVGLNLAEVRTDDPDTLRANDATLTAISLEAALYISKKDLLFIDRDSNELFSPGDRIIYIIRLQNQGQLPITELRMVDSPDGNTKLIPGEVIASTGTVVSGNGPNESSVEVNIPEIAPGEDAFVRLQVEINQQLDDSQIVNQAVVTVKESIGVTGQNRIQSDDPDTNSDSDPTVTTIHTKGDVLRDTMYLPLVQ